ncbi:MAG: autotransporter outer membrane beta-barrel domain-containing protein, partial [Rhodovibrionaceae bacterium]
GATQLAALNRKAEAGTFSFWSRAYGDFTDLDGDQEADSFDGEQYGFAIGADVRVVDSLAIGVAGGYSDNEMDFSSGNSIDYEGFQVALYGSFDPGPFYLDAMASYGWYDNDSRRQTFVPDLRAKGSYDSEVFSVHAETGYAFELMPATITPFAGVRYTRAETDSFTESGAGGFNLDVDKSTAESFTTTLGVDLSAEFQAGAETWITPQLRLGWEHEFEDNYQTVGASFAGVPASAFTVIGSEVASDSAIVGAGVSVNIGHTWELFLDYDGKLNQDVQQHAVSGGVKLSW